MEEAEAEAAAEVEAEVMMRVEQKPQQAPINKSLTTYDTRQKNNTPALWIRADVSNRICELQILQLVRTRESQHTHFLKDLAQSFCIIIELIQTLWLHPRFIPPSAGTATDHCKLSSR